MILSRRETFGQILGSSAALLLLQGCKHMDEVTDSAALYGLIGEIKALPGQRDALIAALLAGSADMPGNLTYMVSKDAGNPDSIWIVEVWRDSAAHRASLQLPQVQEAIRIGRPLMAGFGTRAEVVPAV